jgi:hypothetical protein
MKMPTQGRLRPRLFVFARHRPQVDGSALRGVVRQQLVDPRGGMRPHSEHDVREVIDRVHLVRLARRDKGVEAGKVLARLVVPDEDEVLSSERGDAERALGGVVGRSGGAGLVGEEERKGFPLRDASG